MRCKQAAEEARKLHQIIGTFIHYSTAIVVGTW